MVVDLLTRFGAEERSHGCNIIYFDKKAWRRVQSYLGQMSIKDETKLRSCYLILNPDGEVVTVGYRYERIWRN